MAMSHLHIYLRLLSVGPWEVSPTPEINRNELAVGLVELEDSVYRVYINSMPQNVQSRPNIGRFFVRVSNWTFGFFRLSSWNHHVIYCTK